MTDTPLILIVDDNVLLQQVAVRVLSRGGYRTCTADNGQSALRLTRSDKPDLILLDVALPDISGLEVCRQIKADPALAGSFVVMLSSTRIDSPSQIKGLDGGADGYIARPIPNDELLARVRGLLRIKLAENRLRASEEKYRTLFDSAGDAIFIHDADARMLAVNPLAMARLGYTHAELMSLTIDQVEAPHAPDRIARLMEHGQLLFETTQRCKDGALIPTEVSARRITWEGQPAMMSICRDLTARRQAEKALIDSEEKFSVAFKTSPYAITITRVADGVFIEVNDAFYAMTGFTRAETENNASIGLGLWVDGEDRNRVVQALLGGGTVAGQEFKFKKKNGETLIGLFSAQLIHIKNDTYILSSIDDITERKQAEEALRISESRLHLATSAGNIGIWDWNVAKDELIWDDSMYSLYGIHKDDFGGAYEAWARTLHPDDRRYVEEEIQAAQRGEREYAPEFRVVRPDGIVRVFKAASQTMRDQDGKARRMIGVNYDITERKLAEEALRESEGKFRLAFDTSPDSIAITRLADGIFVSVNKGFEQIL